MTKLFHENNPIMIFLGELFDLMLLNLVTLVCCLPVITIGASITAMHYVLVGGIEEDRTTILKSYLKAFRKNFMQATIIWMILLGIAAVLVSGMIVIAGSDSQIGLVLGFLIVLFSLVLAMDFLYAFPLLARYENSVIQTMKNALGIAISHIPQTGAMLAILIVYAVLLWHHWQGISAFLCLFGISVPGWLYMKLYLPIFQEIEKKE